MENNILELARKRCFDENKKKLGKDKYAPEMKLLERLVFFLKANQTASLIQSRISPRQSTKAYRAIIDEANDRGAKTSDAFQKEFYAAIPEVLEGIIAYSKNLAKRQRKWQIRRLIQILKRAP